MKILISLLMVSASLMNDEKSDSSQLDQVVRHIPLHRVIDSNGDGIISATEIEQCVDSIRSLDADSDGVVRRDELVRGTLAAMQFGDESRERREGEQNERDAQHDERRPDNEKRNEEHRASSRADGDHPAGHGDHAEHDAPRPEGRGDRPSNRGGEKNDGPRADGPPQMDRRPDGDRSEDGPRPKSGSKNENRNEGDQRSGPPSAQHGFGPGGFGSGGFGFGGGFGPGPGNHSMPFGGPNPNAPKSDQGNDARPSDSGRPQSSGRPDSDRRSSERQFHPGMNNRSHGPQPLPRRSENQSGGVIAVLFRLLDTDHNGSLNLNEFQRLADGLNHGSESSNHPSMMSLRRDMGPPSQGNIDRRILPRVIEIPKRNDQPTRLRPDQGSDGHGEDPRRSDNNRERGDGSDLSRDPNRGDSDRSAQPHPGSARPTEGTLPVADSDWI